MINPRQLRDLVILPVLKVLDLPSDRPTNGQAAAQLLLGTAMQESGCGEWIAQVSGPALGIWQMEPATQRDIMRWLFNNNNLVYWNRVKSLMIPFYEDETKDTQPIGNLYFACAMARILYYRVPSALPALNDFQSQAAYYKQWYNTPLGAATVTQYLQNWAIVSKML